MNSKEFGRLQASFKVKEKKVNGFVTVEDETSVSSCQERMDAFEKELEEIGFTMDGNTLITGQRTSLSVGNKKEGAKNQDLYRIARLFVVTMNRKDDDSDIYKLDDLAGKNVAVQSSTQPERIFLEQGYETIPKVKNVYSFVEMNELFAALRKGYVDACAGHEIVMREYLRQSGQKYRILDEEIIDSKLGVAFSKNKDTQKAEQLRQAMAEMLEDGTVQCILEKYGMEDRVAAGGITP